MVSSYTPMKAPKPKGGARNKSGSRNGKPRVVASNQKIRPGSSMLP